MYKRKKDNGDVVGDFSYFNDEYKKRYFEKNAKNELDKIYKAKNSIERDVLIEDYLTKKKLKGEDRAKERVLVVQQYRKNKKKG